MREIVHLQAGQCGNQIGSKVITIIFRRFCVSVNWRLVIDAGNQWLTCTAPIQVRSFEAALKIFQLLRTESYQFYRFWSPYHSFVLWLTSSGRSFLMNMELTQKENMLATAPFSSRESTYTTMKLPVSWQTIVLWSEFHVFFSLTSRRKVCPPRRPGRLGAWHYGFSPLWTIWPNFQTW